MQSTIFMNNLTAIDFAYLTPTVMPDKISPLTGGSLQLSATVTGKLDDHEAVVVDFSKIKKDIKNLVDDNENGFDHKLWVPDDYNTNHPQIEIYEEAGELQITTPNFNTICPTNAVRFVSYDIADCIRKYLQEELEILYPKIGIKIKVDLSTEMIVPDSMRPHILPFRYVHGLKNSSSWGCQNINHGHLSWLAICDKGGNGIPIPVDFYVRLNNELNGACFVWDKNIIPSDNNDIVNIGYKCERGYFESSYSKSAKLRVINTDTTVENLVSWFIDFYRNELTSGVLKAKGAYSVTMSEGLTKGSIKEI
jgi:6-pyruvoyl-tetrahydropterin synthase